MKKHSIPQVVIVGRTNVGKSTLFNRLSDNIKSLTFDSPGVTRDLVKESIEWQGRAFNVIDTGGVTMKKVTDPILRQAQDAAKVAMQEADLLLFVCDGVVGLVQEDLELSRQLHRLGKKVLVLANKIDDKRAQENWYQFNKLGHDRVISISAQHGKGMEDLLEDIVANLPPPTTEAAPVDPAFKIVVLGKPNVGKSSLVNILLNEERFIVADQPGTTREAIGETVRFCQEDILVTDTPGIRKKRAVNDPLETLMVKSSFNAVQEADIVLLLLDSSAGLIVDQELKLAFYVFEQQHKALLLIFNKQDTTDEEHKLTLDNSLELYKHLVDKIVTMSTSCKTGKNVGKVMPTVEKIWQRYTQKFGDDQLTLLFKDALLRKPMYKNQQLLKVFNARQIKFGPPTILLKVNQAPLFGTTQCTFLERVLRDKYDLLGVPVRFVIRNVRAV